MNSLHQQLHFSFSPYYWTHHGIVLLFKTIYLETHGSGAMMQKGKPSGAMMNKGKTNRPPLSRIKQLYSLNTLRESRMQPLNSSLPISAFALATGKSMHGTNATLRMSTHCLLPNFVLLAYYINFSLLKRAENSNAHRSTHSLKLEPNNHLSIC